MAKTKIPTGSWIDRFLDWLGTRRIPALLTVSLFYAATVFVHHALLWKDGILNVGEFSPALLLSVYMWGFLQMAALFYIRKAANESLTQFRPALAISNAEFEKLRHSFVNFSPKGAIIGSILAGLFTLMLAFGGFFQVLSPLFNATLLTTIWAALTIMFFIPFAFGFFYFVFRSLVQVNRIFDKVTRINLFNLEPLYGLARFTSRVGMVFLLYLVLNFATSGAWGSEASGEAITVFYLFLNSGIAILAFLLPLWEIHLRLAAEKQRVSEENNSRLDTAFWELQKRIDKGKLSDIMQFRTSISALMDFRNEIKKIATWPWDPGTLRTFLTALAVPMTVWVVQQVLLRTVVK